MNKRHFILLALMAAIIFTGISIFGTATAQFSVRGYDAEFKHIISRVVTVPYTGGTINITNMKTATANQLDLVFTGVIDDTTTGLTLHGINPKNVLNKIAVWVELDKTVNIIGIED